MNLLNKVCLGLAAIVSVSSFGMMQSQFTIVDGDKSQVVAPHLVSPLLKRMSPDQFKTFIAQGNRIRAIKATNGEYRIEELTQGLQGGGAGGVAAGVAIGQGLVWGVAYSAVAIATAFGSPAAGVGTQVAIQIASPAITAVATKVSLGLGIFFGALTGPV